MNREAKLIKLFAILHKNSQRTMIFLLSIVFITACIIVLTSGNELRYPDEIEYTQLAHSIIAGKGYRNLEGMPTAYRPPGLPFIYSFVFRLWDHPLAAKLLNAVAFTLTALFGSILVGKINPDGKFFVPVLMIFYPLGLYTASTLYPQTLGGMLLVGILLLLQQNEHALIAKSIAGFFYGLLVLVIPGFILVTPLILLGIILGNEKGDIYNRLVHTGIFLFVAIGVMVPWTFRNLREFGAFIPVSTNSGKNFLLGNSENTGPNSGVNVDLDTYREEVLGLTEVESDIQLRKIAFDWIAENPGDAVKLYLQKVINYFNYRNELYVESEASLFKDVIMFLSYYPLLLLAVLRLWFFRKLSMSKKEGILYLLYFGNAFVSAVFFTRIRFRVPFEPLLISMVAIFLGMLVQLVKTKIGFEINDDSKTEMYEANRS